MLLSSSWVIPIQAEPCNLRILVAIYLRSVMDLTGPHGTKSPGSCYLLLVQIRHPRHGHLQEMWGKALSCHRDWLCLGCDPPISAISG